jgi:hypothetical protein
MDFRALSTDMRLDVRFIHAFIIIAMGKGNAEGALNFYRVLYVFYHWRTLRRNAGFIMIESEVVPHDCAVYLDDSHVVEVTITLLIYHTIHK